MEGLEFLDEIQMSEIALALIISVALIFVGACAFVWLLAKAPRWDEGDGPSVEDAKRARACRRAEIKIELDEADERRRTGQ